MRITARLLLAAVVALSVAAYACDDDDAPAPQATATGAAPYAATTATAAPAAVATAAPGPATFRVIGGKAEGAIDVEMFMPQDVRIREGDSIEWTASGIEGHTVTFGTEPQLQAIMAEYLQPDPQDPEQAVFNPEFAYRRGGNIVAGDGAYVNSGFFGIPVEQTYTLTFTKRGLYEYLCVVHPFMMRGSVAVEAPDAAVDSPEDVASRGAADFARYKAVAEAELASAKAVQRTHPAVGGARVHRVAVGLTTNFGQVAAFVPPELNITAGDTVIFENDDRNFHNVVFKGSRPEPPPGYTVYADPGGGGINVAMDKASARPAAPPPGGFDPATFLSSGSMGITMPRIVWRLTFTTPGRYAYTCTLHVFAGMGGVINVAAR